MSKSKKKKNNSHNMTKHHIVPYSREKVSSLENISKVKRKPHQNYHTLFSNKLPEEIIEYLVEDFWNGQWYHVEKAYLKNIRN